MAHARSFEMPGYTGAVLGVLMLGAWLGMSILHVAAQEPGGWRCRATRKTFTAPTGV